MKFTSLEQRLGRGKHTRELRNHQIMHGTKTPPWIKKARARAQNRQAKISRRKNRHK